MNKIYKILIVNLYNELLGAFTDMDAFEKVKFYTKDYDILYGHWTKENIISDYNLDKFNVIKHN